MSDASTSTPVVSSAPLAEASANAPAGAVAAESPAQSPTAGGEHSRAGSRFFVGLAVGMVFATAIALVAFVVVTSDMRSKYSAMIHDVTEKGKGWEAAYQQQTGAPAKIYQSFVAKWEAANTPLERRYVLLRYAPEAGSTAQHESAWKECYIAEYSRWWDEIENRFGPTPDQPEPNPAKALEFYRLGTFSAMCGDPADAHQCYEMALAFDDSLAPAKQGLGFVKYELPADLTPDNPAYEKLAQFAGAWLDADQQKLVAQFEADAGLAKK